MNDKFDIPDDIYESLGEAMPPALQGPHSQYPASLPHDVALASDREELDALLTSHGLTAIDYDRICDMPIFKQEVSAWKQKIISEGYGFKLKLRSIAEGYIPNLVSLLYDPTVAPSTKVDMFKYITKCAELEPKKSDLEGSSDAGKITINIAPYAAAPGAQIIEINAVQSK